ncbi:MAG TPA: acyl-CoA dehydrogenase family protein [Frankiaceae bacterium]|jgi:alkylation response protein AidB-like acyl-CoA dehydrogenase|nr:acyl-CoA dehydrogenase family protein [Frankiaceae bacterium]
MSSSPTDPIADSPERAQLRATLGRVIADTSPPERIARLDEAEEFDEQLHRALAGIDVLRLGLGIGDLRDQLVAIEELGAGPTSMAAFLISHYAAVGLVGRLGGPADLVDAALSGEARISFALSEPDGGTDVARVMQTRAAQASDGWRITGTKLWTSGALEADAIVVFARTSPIQRSPADGITMFLVPRNASGLSIRPLRTFGIHGMSTCEVHLEEVVAPVLGPIDGGLRAAFATVGGESLHAAAACIGAGQGALDPAVAYAKERVVFGRPIGGFQVPQHWLVDGALALEAARGLLWRAASIEIGGGDCAALGAMAKLAASEAAVSIAQHGMQLMGGLGYTRDVALQRLFRDARLWTFSPLTNEMVRNGLGERLLGLTRSY